VFLGSLKKLKYLNISGCLKINLIGLCELSELKQLTSLNISCCRNIFDVKPTTAAQIEKLNILFVKFSTASPENALFPNLITLQSDLIDIKPPAMKYLTLFVPNVKQLSLVGCAQLKKFHIEKFKK